MYGIDYEYGILILQQEAQRLRKLLYNASRFHDGQERCRQYSDMSAKQRDLRECLSLLERYQSIRQEGK